MFLINYKYIISKFICIYCSFFSSFLSINLNIFLTTLDTVWTEFFKVIFLVYISNGYKPYIFTKIKKLRLKQLITYSIRLTKFFIILNFFKILNVFILPNLDIHSNIFFFKNLNANFFIFYLTDAFLWFSFSFIFLRSKLITTNFRHSVFFTIKTCNSIFYIFFLFRSIGLPLNFTTK
jgi:hypothetical protein